MITIDDFRKVELRTAKVLACDPHPNADRLYVLRLDVGGTERQIVSGIRQHYQPEELVGKTIILAANLEPADLRGVTSHGMLLAVRDGEKVVVLSTEKPVPSGLAVS
jgi:methionine--tRNA ligase beta chain